MNKKGNFWFWTGLIILIGWFIFLFINLNKFSEIPVDGNFLVIAITSAFIVGLVVFICASLSKISN